MIRYCLIVRHLKSFFFFDCVGELTKEEDVLEWLVQNKSTGDEEDLIEEVTLKTLNTLIGNIDELVVLFCMFIYIFVCIFIGKNNFFFFQKTNS